MFLQKLFELGDLVGTRPGGGRSYAESGGESDDGRAAAIRRFMTPS
jgi:hypothetical protein